MFWISVTTEKVQYKICKRYSEFLGLHEMLKKTKNIVYKYFPKKTFITLNVESKLEKRRIKLTKFLNYLFALCKKGSSLPEFIQFLQIQEYTQYLLNSLNIRKQANMGLKLSATNNTERELLGMLWKLNFDKNNRMEILKSIEVFFLEKIPKITPQTVSKLILGDSQVEGLLPLVCKNPQDSHLICSCGMLIMIM